MTLCLSCAIKKWGTITLTGATVKWVRAICQGNCSDTEKACVVWPAEMEAV